MLQWMGGARKRINVSKNSLQRRQKQFFEQRRQDRQSQAVNGASCVASHQQDEACLNNVIKSLDIQCLQRLCEDVPGSEEPTSKEGPDALVDQFKLRNIKEKPDKRNEDAALGADNETPAPQSRSKKLSVQATLPYARTTQRETGTSEADSVRDRNKTRRPSASALCKGTLGVSREAKNKAQAPRVPQTKFEVRRKDEAAPRIPETDCFWANRYQNFDVGHACEDSNARLKPLVPTLLQKVGSWLDLPESGASAQLYWNEAHGVGDAVCQEIDTRSWDGDLELDWTPCRLDPQQPAAFELDAEQVTFPDVLMLEPGSLGSPCFRGSSSASFFGQGSSFYPEGKPLDTSFMTFAHKPKETYLDFDLDLQPRSDDFDSHMFLGTRSFESPDSTCQQAPKLGSKSKDGIRSPIPLTVYPEAPDRWDSYQFQSPVQNSQEESVFRTRELQSSGNLSTPMFGIPGTLDPRDLGELHVVEPDPINQRSPANVRQHSRNHPSEATSGENLRENLKRKMVHDASSSSKGTYCVSPVAMSPVSHLAPCPQKSCKRRKQDFWDDQSGCTTFLPSPAMVPGLEEQRSENETPCWTLSSRKAGHRQPNVSEDAEFISCRGKHSRLASMCSSRSLDKQEIGRHIQGEAIRVRACSSGSLQFALHEPPEPGYMYSASVSNNHGTPPSQSVVQKPKSHRVNRKAGSYRSLELSSHQDPGPPAVKKQEGLCASPDGNSNIKLLSSFNLDVYRQKEDKMQLEHKAAADVQTVRDVDIVPLSRKEDPSEEVRSFQGHYGQSKVNLSPTYSRSAGSNVESPKTVLVSPLPRAAAKYSPFSILQSPSSGQKSISSNCNSRGEGLQRLQRSSVNTDRGCEDANRSLNRLSPSGFVADRGCVERPGVYRTSKTVNQLDAVEDASEKGKDKEGEAVVEEEQTAQDPIRTVGSEVSKENAIIENRCLLLESKNEVQMETPHRKRLSNNSISSYPTNNECGPLFARQTKADERMRNPSSSSVLEDREYVGMLESYVVQLKLVNRILQGTAERVDEPVDPKE